MGRLDLSVEGVEGGSVHDVDIEPAVVVVIEQRDAGADGFQDVILLRSAHLVLPGGEAGLLRDVLKDDGAGLHKAAGSDGAILRIENRRKHARGGGAALLRRLLARCVPAIKRRLRWSRVLGGCRNGAEGKTDAKKTGSKARSRQRARLLNQRMTSEAGSVPITNFRGFLTLCLPPNAGRRPPSEDGWNRARNPRVLRKPSPMET